MSVKNNLNPWDSASTQIPTAFPAPLAHDYYSNQEYSNPSQTVTTFPDAQQVPVVEKTKKLATRIKITPDHQKKLKELRNTNIEAWNYLKKHFKEAWDKMVDRNKTMSTENADFINEHAGYIIFNIYEEADQQSDLSIGPQTGRIGAPRKRQLPASSENPDALHLKKQRINLPHVEQTTSDVNVPSHNQIPLYASCVSFHEIPPPTPITAHKESNSPINSNAVNENKSTSNSSQVNYNYNLEFDEFNNLNSESGSYEWM